MLKIQCFKLVMTVGLLFCFSGSAFAEPTDIYWWHAMRGARGEVIQKIVDGFNSSQSEYRVVPIYKGEYDEVVNAGVAALRAGKQPHILQAFEVGTQTMMLSGAIYPIYTLMDDHGYKVDWSQYLRISWTWKTRVAGINKETRKTTIHDESNSQLLDG